MLAHLVRLLAALLFCGAVCIAAQVTGNPAPTPQQHPKPQFFAGTVTDLNDQQITVSRTLVGRAPEHRSFLINAKTKMNKTRVKVRAGVTVEYEHLPKGDVAVEIRIRPAGRPSRPS